MNKERAERLARAEAIGESLKRTGKVDALLGFASLSDTSRMDCYSDLDFLVVPKVAYCKEIIEDLSWLERVAPVVMTCKFTDDGYKVLFEDGILCDFGILTPDQIKGIPHDTGRVIWSNDDFDDAICMATHQCDFRNLDQDQIKKKYALALIDIYVGLSRLNRGEVFSATKVIQDEALEKVLIAKVNEKANNKGTIPDKFQVSRRFEKSYPDHIQILKSVVLGYDGNREAAMALIEIIADEYEISDQVMDLFEKLLEADIYSDGIRFKA